MTSDNLSQMPYNGVYDEPFSINWRPDYPGVTGVTFIEENPFECSFMIPLMDPVNKDMPLSID